jgi:TRAP-type mannitol/chloroaromatic compound transport system substrate-binding protein
MSNLKRKHFIRGLAAAIIGLPLAIRALAGKDLGRSDGGPNIISGERRQWKMVTTWPPNFPVIGEACTLFAHLVEQMSGGRLSIRVYAGGELAPALEAFDVVRGGAAEIGSGSAYYWAGKSPAASFFSAVPFGMNAQQLNAWLISGGGLALWESLYRDFGLIPMPGGNTGVQMGGWFNREIRHIGDFKGLKMRIPGLGGKVLEKAGGAPVLMAGGEIYTGLERGVIDATEWLGPYHDTLMGFHEIAKYYYTPGWHETGTALEFFFNARAFDALPSDLQAILRSASMHVGLWCLSEMEARNAEALERLRGLGVDIRVFPEDALALLRRYTDEVIREMVEKNAFTRKVYESYDAFRRRAGAYANITERVFYNTLQTDLTH